ncbi:MAG: FG-GAP-like repeat-containing protein [Candidatus Adiutrix sp.]|jgi:hypothetical protein|nr:FG-GAP-like repeat-containing protein [Candidatus Adiutrix sp.]
MRNFKLTLLLALVFLVGSFPAGAEDQPTGRHPKYNMIGRDAPPPTSPLNPNFVVAEESKLSESGFWRSTYITESLVGLGVGDVDGDGRNEVVYASSHNVYVTRFTEKTLQQLAVFNHPATDNIVSLDLMDLDGDGKLEIIVSSQNEAKSAASFILAFNGQELTPLAKNLPWYLRVVGGHDAQFLAGQKPATTRNEYYIGSVMRVSFNGSSITSQGPVGLPPFVNIFNFTLGRLASSNTQMTAAIKFPAEHIFLFESANRSWESKEEYGGTMIYLDSPNPVPDSSRREYLPSRILIADIDGDGQNELIVAKNDRGGVPFMSKQRAFTSGAIQAFKYTNMSLTPFFRTRTLPGPGVDYTLADFNNDGTQDLVVAVVTEQKSGMLKDGRSVIVAYELK